MSLPCQKSVSFVKFPLKEIYATLHKAALFFVLILYYNRIKKKERWCSPDDNDFS